MEENPFLNPVNFHRVKSRQDKAISHTSKSTNAVLEKMKIDKRMETSSFSTYSSKIPRYSIYRPLCLLSIEKSSL